MPFQSFSVGPGEDDYDESDYYSTQEEARNRLRSQGKEYGRRCCKCIIVSLAVLCVTLFIAVIYQGVNCRNLTGELSTMKVAAAQHSDKYGILDKEKEQLQKNVSMTVKNMTDLQAQYNQLQKNYMKLEETKNKLISEKNNYQQQCSSLQKDKDEIQKNYDALLSKLPLLQKYCHTTEKERVCDPCPQGWEKHNGQCYYFSTSVTTWNESQNNCIKEAAHLVTVNSEEEQDFITKEGSSSYWIGLTDSAEEGVWRWVDGTDLKQGFWLYGEPDNKDQQSAGITANCVINSREWKDEPCEDQYRWICETQTLHPKPLHI
ncbi:uncharacterized protein [Paramormyrops kingsleyae]|uniref:uncharacterized protein n=1 Tax=Paramormyrops kingsleyae TaxID=1676925 RepID=UPI003B96B275